jgi:hypothetical protein
MEFCFFPKTFISAMVLVMPRDYPTLADMKAKWERKER